MLVERPLKRIRSRPRPAVCHPDKPSFGRALCSLCWAARRRDGTLAEIPTLRRGPAPSGRYPRRRKQYEASVARHRVDVDRALRAGLEDGPHAAPCRCALPAPRTEGPLLVCGLCSREVAAA